MNSIDNKSRSTIQSLLIFESHLSLEGSRFCKMGVQLGFEPGTSKK